MQTAIAERELIRKKAQDLEKIQNENLRQTKQISGSQMNHLAQLNEGATTRIDELEIMKASSEEQAKTIAEKFNNLVQNYSNLEQFANKQKQQADEAQLNATKIQQTAEKHLGGYKQTAQTELDRINAKHAQQVESLTKAAHDERRRYDDL